MAVTCSLLGHDYGAPEVVRSREENGNEVVETVREVKTCERCGKEQVVSENTEVRSIREPEDVGLDADATNASSAGTGDAREAAEQTTSDATDASTGSEEGIAGRGAADDSGATGGESVDAGDAAGSEDAPAEAAGDAEGFTNDDFEPPQSAEEDDGIILEDEADENEAGREQWSSPDTVDDPREEAVDDSDAPADDTGGEAATDGDANAGGWPASDGVDEGFNAANPADDDDGDDAGVSFDGSLTPSRTGEDAAPAKEDAEVLGSDDSGQPSSAGSARGRNADTEILVCGDCGHQVAPERLSLRAGDICPECHRGYLESDASSL